MKCVDVTDCAFPPLVVAALLASVCAQGAEPAHALPAQSKQQVLGLLITGIRYAIEESPGAKECPQGFNKTQHANYKAQFPTEEARSAHEKRFGYNYGNRGPQGENVFYNPTAADDPLPFRESQSSTAPGLDLDGKTGPEDYTTPDGRTGIDNQLNRVLGCVEGVRKNGLVWSNGYRVVRQYAVNRLMFEISGVDDLQNDPEVMVRSYRGLDPINVSGGDVPTPGGTQRIDFEGGRRYMTETKGHIQDGILVTDPVDLKVPWVNSAMAFDEFKLRGAKLRLKLTPSGAEGVLGGFADLQSWWLFFTKGYGAGVVAETAQWSPSSLYKALLANADGDRGADGAPTAISMALQTEFVAVYIRHDRASEPEVKVAGQVGRVRVR